MRHKIILGIDPGPVKSAYVYLCGMTILKAGYADNSVVLYKIQDSNYDLMAVEGVRSFGPKKRTGNSTIITCELAGIFYQAARSRGKLADILYSNTTRRNGARSIRGYFGNRSRDDMHKVIKDIIPGCYGDKKNPGPLYMTTREAKKQDHRLCAAEVAVVYQGSKQYQKECSNGINR